MTGFTPIPTHSLAVAMKFGSLFGIKRLNCRSCQGVFIELTANIAGRAQAVLKFFKMAAVESFG